MSGALLWCSVAQASPGNDAAREAMESAAEKELVTLEKRPFAKAGRGELSLGVFYQRRRRQSDAGRRTGMYALFDPDV